MLSETSKVILTIIEKQLENGDNKGLKEYGVLIDNADDKNYHWNVEAMQEMADALKYQQKEIEKNNNIFNNLSNENLELRKEIEFLKQRNKELRQKTYINVYDENLQLQKENKALKHENIVKFNDLVKYEKNIDQLRKELIKIGQLADSFRRDSIELKEENNQLKGVLESVETFIGQYAIR